MKLLTTEQQESYENSKICHICNEKFQNKYLTDKKYRTVRNHCHHSICNLKCSVPIKIHVFFHNGSSCDYHFIIKELAEEFYLFRRKY